MHRMNKLGGSRNLLAHAKIHVSIDGRKNLVFRDVFPSKKERALSAHGTKRRDPNPATGVASQRPKSEVDNYASRDAAAVGRRGRSSSFALPNRSRLCGLTEYRQSTFVTIRAGPCGRLSALD
jgi:hypothetical protein